MKKDVTSAKEAPAASSAGEGKKRNILRTALACVFLAAALAVGFGSSYAWLGSNRVAEEDGVELSLDTYGNIVISNSTTEIVKADLDSINSGSPFRLTIPSNATKYSICMHDPDYTTYASGLKYVTNTEVIGISSGVSTGDTLTYAPAVNGGETYYIDFTVYIASHTRALSSATLTASIASAIKNGSAVTSGSLMATSIDFYGNSVSSGNYLGTLNVAGLNIGSSHNDYPNSYSSSDTKPSVYLVGSSSTTGSIPLNTTSYLTYVLRCYFDGALLSGAGQTYINTATLDVSKVTLNLVFTATGVES